MRLPREVSGEDLCRALRRFGYEVTRQTGSHMRLSSAMSGTEHHVTIPAHKQLRVGTLAQILGDVALNLGLTREEVVRQLFG